MAFSMATRSNNYLSRIKYKSLLHAAYDQMELKHFYGKEACKWPIQDLERLGYKCMSGWCQDVYKVYVHMKTLSHLQVADEIGQRQGKFFCVALKNVFKKYNWSGVVVTEWTRPGMNSSSVNQDEILQFSEAFIQRMAAYTSVFLVHQNQWSGIFTLVFIDIKICLSRVLVLFLQEAALLLLLRH